MVVPIVDDGIAVDLQVVFLKIPRGIDCVHKLSCLFRESLTPTDILTKLKSVHSSNVVN